MTKLPSQGEPHRQRHLTERPTSPLEHQARISGLIPIAYMVSEECEAFGTL